MTTLTDIHQQVLACTACPLHLGCKSPIPGDGFGNEQVMFVGEGPGAEEDQQGKPFMGVSGQMLREYIDEANSPITFVPYFTNVVKCRPPHNRDPSPAEIRTCQHFLNSEVLAINPRVIVTVGRFAMMQFLPDALITQVHGRPQVVLGRVILPIIHTAAALRSPEYIPLIKRDLALVPRLLETALEPQEHKLTIL